MFCKDCELRLPYDKAPEMTVCTICGKPFIPTVEDILEFGMFNITKEIRPTQIALGQDIEGVLHSDSQETLLAEGGTGIGKSFALLITTYFPTTSKACPELSWTLIPY